MEAELETVAGSTSASAAGGGTVAASFPTAGAAASVVGKVVAPCLH